MCLRFFINKEWIVSTTARRIYLISTILNVALIFLEYWLILSSHAVMSDGLSVALGSLLYLCVFGAATTFVAMLFHFVLFNRYSLPKSILCALAMYLYPIGPPLYFFLVYWRSPEFRVPSEIPQVVSAGA
jgi:hypothetical protein